MAYTQSLLLDNRTLRVVPSTGVYPTLDSVNPNMAAVVGFFPASMLPVLTLGIANRSTGIRTVPSSSPSLEQGPTASALPGLNVSPLPQVIRQLRAQSPSQVSLDTSRYPMLTKRIARALHKIAKLPQEARTTLQRFKSRRMDKEAQEVITKNRNWKEEIRVLKCHLADVEKQCNEVMEALEKKERASNDALNEVTRERKLARECRRNPLEIGEHFMRLWEAENVKCVALPEKFKALKQQPQVPSSEEAAADCNSAIDEATRAKALDLSSVLPCDAEQDDRDQQAAANAAVFHDLPLLRTKYNDYQLDQLTVFSQNAHKTTPQALEEPIRDSPKLGSDCILEPFVLFSHRAAHSQSHRLTMITEEEEDEEEIAHCLKAIYDAYMTSPDDSCSDVLPDEGVATDDQYSASEDNDLKSRYSIGVARPVLVGQQMRARRRGMFKLPRELPRAAGWLNGCMDNIVKHEQDTAYYLPLPEKNGNEHPTDGAELSGERRLEGGEEISFRPDSGVVIYNPYTLEWEKFEPDRT